MAVFTYTKTTLLALHVSLLMCAESNAALTFYTNRTLFNNAASGNLITEDFEENTFTGPANSRLNSSSVGNGVVAGWIPQGIEFVNPSANSSDNDFIIYEGGTFGVPSASLSMINSAHLMRITFQPGVTAVGFDLALYDGSSSFLDGTANIDVLGGIALIGSQTFTAGSAGPSFFGVIASGGDIIETVDINGVGANVELVDNVTFNTPEPSSVGLIAMGCSFLCFRRRRS